MNVDVVSTTAALWSGEASSVVVPAAGGSMGILAGHEPVLALLKSGTVKITPTSGEKVELEVDEGFVSVDEDAVTVVVEDAAGAGI
ncbi:F0F1 ATP synthase subunit epsilon [Georgenia deserti]|uniref:F0F1 ATP synthase subunit epsilon n=1 Tax=Georgenia deserti TaxID=2093781 RepID=A0ABW4L370_9MICO